MPATIRAYVKTASGIRDLGFGQGCVLVFFYQFGQEVEVSSDAPAVEPVPAAAYGRAVFPD
jgi:hypothetical protein